MDQEVTSQTLTVEDFNDKILQDKFQSCKHFLVDCEIEKVRHNLFDYAIEMFNTSHVGKKRDHFGGKKEICSQIEFSFGFILKKVLNDRTFRFF